MLPQALRCAGSNADELTRLSVALERAAEQGGASATSPEYEHLVSLAADLYGLGLGEDCLVRMAVRWSGMRDKPNQTP